MPRDAVAQDAQPPADTSGETTPQDAAEAAEDAESGDTVAAEGDVALSPQLLASREVLEAGEADVPALAIHAMRLLDAGELEALSGVLSGSSRNATLGVLQALQASSSDALLRETIHLASTTEDPEVSRLALNILVHLVRQRGDVTERLIEALDDELSPGVARRTVVTALGKSRNLTAVEPLIGLLGGPQGPEARAGLEELTGHAFGEDAVAWAEFWERAHGEPRDVLLERSLAAEKKARKLSEETMREEVIQARIGSMGVDVDLLAEGLADSYAAVRLASAQLLGSHSNPEQAATAIPMMLARLGYATSRNGNGNGQGHGNGQAARPGDPGGPPGPAEQGAWHRPTAAVEVDAQVRAALVAAVGVLGRGDPLVLDVLLNELRSADVVTAAVAAKAFARLRNHPAVVDPLLSYLERAQVDEATQVAVLGVVAANEPAGVLDRLAAWLGPEHDPTVRAAAVAAVLACAELDRALDALSHIVAEEEVREVRYALARALGDRSLGLPTGESERVSVLELLGQLLDDVDSSVRAEAASSLGEAGGPEAFFLLDLRSHAEVDVSVMTRILHALGQIGDPEGVGAIGRVCSSWVGEGSAELKDASRRALQALGEGATADAWLAMAGTLKTAGCPDLASWALREILLRHEGDPGSRDVVSLARGHLAEVLCLNGQGAEAYQMLVELHEAGAPYPGLRLRLELLARTAEELELVDEAAEYYLERLGELAEGDATRLETQRGAVRTMIAAGRYQQVLPLVHEVYEQDTSDNNTMFQLGRVQAALGRDREAVDTLRRLLPRIPDEAEALRIEVETLVAEIEPHLIDASDEELPPGTEDLDPDPDPAADEADGSAAEASEDDTPPGDTDSGTNDR